MNRERFEQLLSAYGADMRRWPAQEAAAGAAFAARPDETIAALVAKARALDAALDAAALPEQDLSFLQARILKSAPKLIRPGSFERRALFALAACAVLGVLIGYGGGRFALAPAANVESEDYLSAAFAAPYELGEGG